jgi:hypothetical protein
MLMFSIHSASESAADEDPENFSAAAGVVIGVCIAEESLLFSTRSSTKLARAFPLLADLALLTLLEPGVSGTGGVKGVPTLVEDLSKRLDEVEKPEHDEPELDADDAMGKSTNLGRKGVFLSKTRSLTVPRLLSRTF